jgi:hypothetical protein
LAEREDDVKREAHEARKAADLLHPVTDRVDTPIDHLFVGTHLERDCVQPKYTWIIKRNIGSFFEGRVSLVVRMAQVVVVIRVHLSYLQIVNELKLPRHVKRNPLLLCCSLEGSLLETICHELDLVVEKHEPLVTEKLQDLLFRLASLSSIAVAGVEGELERHH